MHVACVAAHPEPWPTCFGLQAVLLARLEAQDQLESVLEHLSDEMHKSLQVGTCHAPPTFHDTPVFYTTAPAEPVHISNLIAFRCDEDEVSHHPLGPVEVDLCS